MIPRAAPLACSLFLAAAFAGCVGGNDAVSVPSDLVNPNLTGEALKQAVDEATKITKDSIVGPPVWTKGEYWSTDVFFGDQFSPGVPISYNDVVADDSGDSYLVLPDTRPVAVFDALFDIPFMGTFKKADLETTDGGKPFRFYDWPLQDGKTWQAQAVNFDGRQTTYTFHVAFKADIATPKGPLPGFQIHGLNATNVVLFEWDYIPALHWFTHAYFYNAQDPKKFDIHIMVGAHGYNWKGDVLSLAAEELLNHEWYVILNPSDPTQSGVAQKPPLASFDVNKDYTSLAGFVWAANYLGAHETNLVSPSNQQYEVHTVHADPNSFSFQFLLMMNAPSEKGSWKFVSVGAGVVTLGGAVVWGITDTTIHVG